jgi:hypothetical protein
MVTIMLVNLKTGRENASLWNATTLLWGPSFNHLSCDNCLLQIVKCNATQTQSVQKKSSSATIQRDKKG